MDKTEIKKSIIMSQHCQRNWDLDKEIPQEDIDVILQSVTQCPSKQNIAHYNVHAITDRALIEKIHDVSYGESANTPGKQISNPQTLANLLLVFTRRNDHYEQAVKHSKKRFRNAEQNSAVNADEKAKFETDTLNDANVALGIAAGYCNLASSLLGYRTGCSSCGDKTAVRNILGLPEEEKVLLLMGVGHNKEGVNRRLHHQNHDFMFPTHVKEPINVTWHK